MLKLIMLAFLLTACDQAEVAQKKELLRDKLGPLLGDELTTRLLGKSAPKIKLPELPEVKRDATSIEVYDKSDDFSAQARAFDALSLEEKRKYRLAFIQELYQVTRNTDPKDEDVLNFLNVLEQGGTREGVYRAIVLDSVYASLESFEEAPSSELKEFSRYFGEKYLGRKFSKQAMSKLNLWSIKRILVEKALEVIEALEKSPKDLKSWYAVLSADLASRENAIWKNKVRKQSSRKFHFEWAGKVPLQQIKSETIIKLHTLMNKLNG